MARKLIPVPFKTHSLLRAGKQPARRLITVGGLVIYINGDIEKVARMPKKTTQPSAGMAVPRRKVRNQAPSHKASRGARQDDRSKQRIRPTALASVAAPALSPEEQTLIAEILISPPPMAPALQRAMADYKRLVRQVP